MAQPAVTATQAKPPTRRSKILRCIAIIALTSLVALGIGVLIKWLFIRPSQMFYMFKDGSITYGFAVRDASIHVYDLRGNTLNATFKLNTRAFNPISRASIHYESIKVQMWFQDQMIASAEVPPFSLFESDWTDLAVAAVAGSMPLQENVSKEFKHQRSLDHVELEVHMQARARFKVGLWKSKYFNIRVLCSPVKLSFSPPNNFLTQTCCRDNKY